MVLILVLIVVVMISLAGFSFVELMYTENRAAHLHGDELRLRAAQGSAVEAIIYYCEQPAMQQQTLGGPYDNPGLFQSVPLKSNDRGGEVPVGAARFSVVAPRIEDGEVAGIRFGLENESGRLHLADVLQWDELQPGTGRKALMGLPGMIPAIADAILDWIDADGDPRETGAETDYYAGLPRPYAPRNKLPESLDELLLVKGVTHQLLYGADLNCNYQIDPEEETTGTPQSRGAAAGNESVGWASLLTIYSGQRNVTLDGRPRIDLNSPDLAQLQQQLTAELDATWAAFIVAYRQYGPYGGADPGQPGPPPVTPGSGGSVQIRSAMDLVGARVALPSPTPQQPPRVFASPIPADAQQSAQQLAKLLDKTTVAPLPVLRGGVSVNHAPRVVLLAVPGMDESLADRILAARGARSSGTEGESAARAWPTWIFSEGLCPLETMQKLMPYLTAGGDVVRAQVIGHTDKPGATARAEVVLDSTVRPVRIVAWRDLRLWGAGFPQEWLSEASGAGERHRRSGRGTEGSRQKTSAARPASK